MRLVPFISCCRSLSTAVLCFGLVCVHGARAQNSSGAAPTIESALGSLQVRAIGPAGMGGRIDDIAVAESDPRVVYIGAATGGVWKTSDGGTTWKPIFDHELNSSIGALAVAPSDPSIVWVGTGEANNRQSSSWGDGVYRSMDGGKTWLHVGLDDTECIGRIVIDPENPEIVYVAAAGHLWGPNPERGLFKTTNGGKTWAKVLFLNDDTGVTDVAIDPQSPNTLYAATYERRRTVWGFDGGGPGSGIYKTTDGGNTWTKLTKDLPNDDNTGRIGLAVYRKDPSIVYALIQNAEGGVFRTEDAGATWKKMSSTDPRPSYFSQIRVDPNNDLRIWLGGVNLYYSDDGGRTFSTDRVRDVHPDFHALWIDPSNSRYMLTGCDGGVYVSRDAGRDWQYLNVIPLGQAYEIGYDNQQPYHVCAGYQDNAEWCGPSRTLFAGGISNSAWFMVGSGDGFYVKPDPDDPETVYTESESGNLNRRNLRTNEARSIRPVPQDGAPPYRFNWDSPFLISSHDHDTIYYGGNFLFKSADRGDSWVKLGGDLTTGVERNTLPILGKLPSKNTLSLDDGVSWYPTITEIAESPVTPAVLWVGTDDGNLQVSRDGGRTWRNVASRLPGVPQGTYVSRIVASRYGAGKAYAALDGHRSNDFHVYLFKTTDYGHTWNPISAGLPESSGTVHVIREHPSDPNLLFVGMEFGAYFSLDDGMHWNRLRMGLPTVPVDDIQIQPRENDLILATHGRSLYILDDLTPIEDLNSNVLDENLHLFPIRKTIAWRIYSNQWFDGQQVFLGRNPPYGALVSFYLKTKPAEGQQARITILDRAGRVIRHIDDPHAQAGINRVHWDLHYDPPVELTAAQAAQQAAAPVYGFLYGGPSGPMVEPGIYTVEVSFGKDSETQTVEVQEDPRIQVTPAARIARQDALMKLYRLYQNADRDEKTIVALKNALNNALASWKKHNPAVPESIQEQVEVLSKKVNLLGASFVSARAQGAPPALQYEPPPLPQQIGQLASELEAYTAAPTQREEQEVVALSQRVVSATGAVHTIVSEDLPRLNKALNRANVPFITVSPERSKQHLSDQ